MRSNKYSTFLTVLLIIIIIAVIGAGIFFLIRHFRGGETTEGALRRMDQTIEDENNDIGDIGDMDGLPPEYATTGADGRTSIRQRRERIYYQGYVMVGQIHIPRTNIRYPILERGTNRSLDIAVAVMWPEDPELYLNEPGNVIIMGHNYRNQRFFSQNHRLQLGDPIHITDRSGRTVTYRVFETFTTTDTDMSFIEPAVSGAIEITLTTCTDDSVRRTIVRARAE